MFVCLTPPLLFLPPEKSAAKPGLILSVPPIADCFLNGITRQTVIGLAKDAGIEVVERHIMPEEMAQATECFLTGTAAEVTPVSRVQDYSFTPGDTTRMLVERYFELVNS